MLNLIRNKTGKTDLFSTPWLSHVALILSLLLVTACAGDEGDPASSSPLLGQLQMALVSSPLYESVEVSIYAAEGDLVTEFNVGSIELEYDVPIQVGLTPGFYEIDAGGLDTDGSLVAEGAAIIEVFPGETTAVEIILEEIDSNSSPYYGDTYISFSTNSVPDVEMISVEPATSELGGGQSITAGFTLGGDGGYIDLDEGTFLFDNNFGLTSDDISFEATATYDDCGKQVSYEVTSYFWWPEYFDFEEDSPFLILGTVDDQGTGWLYEARLGEEVEVGEGDDAGDGSIHDEEGILGVIIYLDGKIIHQDDIESLDPLNPVFNVTIAEFDVGTDLNYVIFVDIDGDGRWDHKTDVIGGADYRNEATGPVSGPGVYYFKDDDGFGRVYIVDKETGSITRKDLD